MNKIKEEIANLIKEGFNREFEIKQKRPNLFQIYIPYYYPDGDMIEIFIKKDEKDNYVIQDLGMTLMRLSYDFNINSKNKRKLFYEILGNYQIVENESNLLTVCKKEDLFPYLMEFVQVITK
ncbi:MAG: DUF1828 domain-containing protein, partial [Romboutsia sp.]|nr:DUF1828 domain-containing protein [Romboutsia sp.]